MSGPGACPVSGHSRILVMPGRSNGGVDFPGGETTAEAPKDCAAIADGISHGISGLRQSGALDTISAFGALSKAAMADGALDKRTKELIALVIGAAKPRDGCFGFHTKALKRLGAADQEVAESLAVAIYVSGGPGLMYVCDAWQALEDR